MSTGLGTTGSKLGKEYKKTIYCHPVYLTSLQSTLCEISGWMNHNIGIKIVRKNINKLRYVDGATLTAASEEAVKSLLMRVKEENEKPGLKLNIQETEIMASSAITSWQVDGGKVKAGTDLIFLGFKTSADDDCNHEIKTFAPWKESYEKPRKHSEKQRPHFANQGAYSQSYGFFGSHVWM